MKRQMENETHGYLSARDLDIFDSSVFRYLLYESRKLETLNPIFDVIVENETKRKMEHMAL